MLEQCLLYYIIGVEDFSMLFQIAAAHTPVFSYLIVAVIGKTRLGIRD